MTQKMSERPYRTADPAGRRQSSPKPLYQCLCGNPTNEPSQVCSPCQVIGLAGVRKMRREAKVTSTQG